MSHSTRAFALAAVSFALALFATAAPSHATTSRLDRAFVIVMENQGFDNVIGHDDANGNPDTPYITSLATQYGLMTFAFGVTHPSLPNYLAMIGGYTNNISDDNDSCYALPAPGPGCHKLPYTNIVDELVSAHIAWDAYEESMPSAGFLGSRYPLTGPKLYAQKHNPFVYFTDIATNPERLSHIKPLDGVFSQLRADLARPATAPRFVYIVPNQCDDMHGTTGCSDNDTILRMGDAYLRRLIPTIMQSPSFTSNSAIFVTWDENDYSSNLGAVNSLVGGGHIPSLVITKRYTHPLQSALPSNHYSLFATIEDGLGIPRLVKSGLVPPTYFSLLP